MKMNKDSDVFTDKLEENLFFLREHFVHSEDFILDYAPLQNEEAYLVYIETIVDKKTIEERIIKPMNIGSMEMKLAETFILETNSVKEITKRLLEGSCVLVRHRTDLLLVFDAKSPTSRNIKEPETEGVIRGSHEGFIEPLSTNIALIRKRVHNQNIKIKYFTIGFESNTKVAIIYLDHIANSKIVQTLEEKLSQINIDYVLAPGHIEEFLSSNMTIFPTMLSTERSDRTVANILDGRVAVIADNSPSALIVPATFFTFFQSPDDYNSRPQFGSFIRFLRLVGFLITVMLPALYIAIVSFHYEILPTEIIFSIKSSLEYVPYPPLIEALAMQITLEILREAAIRLPSRIAQTIGVVGGLVIGTAVVEANLVSNTMIIVVAITAISSFMIPITEMGSSIRMLGFPFMLMAAMFGFIGMSFLAMFVLIHLCKLESFGTPYFSPLSTLQFSELKDTLIRVPLPFFKKRPRDTQPKQRNKKS
ncbi:spore germination protein [Sutcliffiella rhizosphaerae]|uniref:Spore germination protein B1 n=1 Tax=Sutcliffiella rhizosphaerae TaxID=2880967 RepID=A0ABM8YKP8_9BACI|nr:spore germination protein [Sutcliffiella rhizosphaerae]CAG9620520.1 Spore germination protein B1 [Sutcliffiella rhizosphaerae]